MLVFYIVGGVEELVCVKYLGILLIFYEEFKKFFIEVVFIKVLEDW